MKDKILVILAVLACIGSITCFAIIVKVNLDIREQLKTEQDDIVVKHMVTETIETDYLGTVMTSTVTYFWIDSNCERHDQTDERATMHLKLWICLRNSYKDKNVNSIYKYFADKETGEADWVLLDVSSVKVKAGDGQVHVISLSSEKLRNPYYEGNWYFEREIFPKL